MKDYIKWFVENKDIAEMLLSQSIMILIWGQCIAWVIKYIIDSHTKYHQLPKVDDSPIIISSTDYLKLKMKENRYHVVVAACIVITILIATIALLTYFNGGVV